jgi:Tfp pilus assembly protein PilX
MKSKGQIVLIILLVLTIATTIALSLISRSTTDTLITSQTEESLRAFSAAEAGIEEALKTQSGTAGPTGIVGAAGVSYNVSVQSIGVSSGLFTFPQMILRGETQTLWLVSHNSDGTLNETPTYTASSIGICWSDSSPKSALAVGILYKKASGEYRIVKITYDPDAVRAVTNNFNSSYIPGGCGGGTGTLYKETITFNSLPDPINPASDTIIALRIRPVYNNTNIVIDTDAAVLPQQGNRIESTGTTLAGTNRKILVYQQFRSPSTLFDAALYSQGALIQ